ncbi:ylmG homolog protein 2, chloroplastic [Rosa rugosa]|uniref:ylmG homolog protein 2, chloroplastic n=1 Tax=Rosa rugosa TaxID=74645 RepID=UPI002B40F4E6|nr:ylmG homolog protein 2, chloroplastic [Rosa rugosa]
MAQSELASATESPKSLPPTPHFTPYFSMLLSPTNFAPFLRSSSPSSSSSKKPSFVLPDIQSSIASATHNCLELLHSLASQNPFLNKLISFHGEFQSFCHQVQTTRYRKLKSLSTHNFAAVLPGDSVAGLVVANGVSNFLNLYNTLLVCRLVLTWFPNSPPAIVGPLSTICDPYLNIFRGLIPPLGGTLDLSPILAFLVLNAFTSTAAALPAELPASPAASQELGASSATGITHLTTPQKKWITRLQGSNTKS